MGGLFFSQSVSVYDLNNDGNVVAFEPDLCDFIAQCDISPCLNAICAMNAAAVCEEDRCGGCNTKWFCGTADVTAYCERGPSVCDALVASKFCNHEDRKCVDIELYNLCVFVC